MTLDSRTTSILAESGPLNWTCVYWCITPSGSKGRFTRDGSVHALDGGEASEWLVLAYLRNLHAGCTINIISCKFK